MPSKSRLYMVLIDAAADVHPALEKATVLARHTGAGLYLFASDSDSRLSTDLRITSDELAQLRDAFVEERKAKLEALAVPVRGEGIEVQCEAAWHRPAVEGMVARIAALNPDLVIKDTHYHSLAKRVLITNTDWRLIRQCTRPLLLVKAAPWKENPIIAAAVDPGSLHDKPLSLERNIVEAALGLSNTLHGSLHVLHAFGPVTTLAVSASLAAVPFATGATEQDFHDTARKIETDDVMNLVSEYGIEEQAVYVTEGTTVDVLLSHVRENAVDIVVMGAVARSAMQRLFVGSTAEKTLDRLPADLLVVHPYQEGKLGHS